MRARADEATRIIIALRRGRGSEFAMATFLPLAVCATDPCVAAATKAAQALGCVVLKLEQTQVITGILRGRDVFAVCLLATERRCVTPSHPLRSTSSILAVYHQLLLLTAIMRDQASGWLHAPPCCSMCPCMRDVNLCALVEVTCTYYVTTTFQWYGSLMLTSPDYFFPVK